MDKLTSMQLFVRVAETGSFSEAARQAGVVPSVMAKRVDQLEWRIRAPLFTRTTRKLHLTDVGERYLPVLRHLVQQMESTLDGMAVADACAQLRGRLAPIAAEKLSCDPTLIRFSVPSSCDCRARI